MPIIWEYLHLQFPGQYRLYHFHREVLRLAKMHPNIVGLKDTISGRNHIREVIKEAAKLRGIAATSAGTFPMPNATVEDDARILELLRREGIRA